MPEITFKYSVKSVVEAATGANADPARVKARLAEQLLADPAMLAQLVAELAEAAYHKHLVERR